MKYLVVIALFGLAAAAPQQARQQPEITLVRSEADNNEDGTFKWSYELSDGTRAEQNGYVKQNPDRNADPENQQIQVIQGSFSYPNPEGGQTSLTYVADENGFVPQGDHLPVAPPTPDHVLQTLRILEANAAAQVQRAKKHITFQN